MIQLKEEPLGKISFFSLSFLQSTTLLFCTIICLRQNTNICCIYIYQKCVVLSYYLILMNTMFYTEYIVVREVQSNSTSGIIPDSMERQTSWINMDFTYHQGNNVISTSLQCWYIYSACPRCRVNKKLFFVTQRWTYLHVYSITIFVERWCTFLTGKDIKIWAYLTW